jgi:hypothetical protein
VKIISYVSLTMAFSDTLGTMKTWFSPDETNASEKDRLIGYYHGKMAALDREKLIEERRTLVAARFVQALTTMANTMPIRSDRYDLDEVLERYRAFFDVDHLASVTHPYMSEGERTAFPELAKLHRIIQAAFLEAGDEELEVSYQELYPEPFRQTDALRELSPGNTSAASGKIRMGHRMGRLAKSVRERWRRIMDDLAELQGL